MLAARSSAPPTQAALLIGFLPPLPLRRSLCYTQVFQKSSSLLSRCGEKAGARAGEEATRGGGEEEREGVGSVFFKEGHGGRTLFLKSLQGALG